MGILSKINRLPGMVLRRLPAPMRREAVEVLGSLFEEAAYHRLAELGFRPAAVLDVGAYQGDWTRQVRRTFPGTPVLMVEPQESKRPILDEVCAALPGVSYVSTVLGSESGKQVPFYEMETGSSLLPEQTSVPRTERVLTTQTLDQLTEEKFAGKQPLFLKLDVQGAELQVLAGGRATLSRCEVVQLEIAFLPFNQGAPTLLEVLAYMDAQGFVPFEIAGLNRTYRRDLLQGDVLFVRRESTLRTGYL